MGRIKNGKRKDKHKYPDDESPLRHEKNETTIEHKSIIMNGIIIICILINPGPRLSGGYFIKFNCSSLGQFINKYKFIKLTKI